MMRRTPLLALLLLALLGSAAPASAAFGLKDLDVRFTDSKGAALFQAGAHPYEMITNLAVETRPEPGLPEVPDGEVRHLEVTQIPGLAGNPTAVPPCSTIDFLDIKDGLPSCSRASRVGTTDVTVGDPNTVIGQAVYNLSPPPGVAAKIGFVVLGVPITVELGVNPNPPYNIVASLTNVSNVVGFYGSQVRIWGVPADKAHDAERGGPANIAPKPFLTLPRACEGPLATVFEALSWSGGFFGESILTHDDSGQPLGFTDCARLGFAPEAVALPSTDRAESPMGLTFELEVDDEGLADPEGTALSDIKRAAVTLPAGVTLNPSIAEGLATCSPQGFGAESLDSEPGEGCPAASKVGTIEAQTPLLEGKLLRGELFVATQDDPTTTTPGAENPFDSLLALYIVVKHPELGVLVKLAGRVEPDPATGQIRTIFGEAGHELPQFPLSRVAIRLREGARSPLISPPSCATYTTEALFTPWADPSDPLAVTSSFAIVRGTDGGACPAAPPFDPALSAGSLNANAASYSPFHLRLTRRDGDQDLTRFSAKLPAGVTGKLAGVSRCADAQIAAAKPRRGREELASPSCPANSRIGRVIAGAGVGSQLTYVEGSLYLAGPHKGAPLSVVSIVPAVAGPFDVGTVVTQLALRIDPRSAEVRVDGASSDPIPHILAGIPLKVRDIRAYAERPDFTLNPTDCDPTELIAEIWGGGTDVFSPADDAPVTRAQRYQAANCASLGFRPRLSLKLKGGTKRGAHPALRAVFRPRAGDANTSRVLVRFPRSAFIDQGHIRTVCTRVQFARDACPPAAVYGSVRAFTPLLEEPLAGPVYLRSSDNELPDLVFDLHGLVDFEAVARIDSIKGGLRATVAGIPDVPITKVEVQMQGAKKGLIVNSADLCKAKSRAKVALLGHNDKRRNPRPLVKPTCRKR